MRIKRPNISKKKSGMIAAFALIAIIGGAAALIQLSNILSADFTLNTNLPLEIEWATGDPSSAWISLSSPITEYINYTNIAPVTLTEVIVTVTFTCPVGMTVLLCNMYVEGSPILVFTGVDNVFTATRALADIGPNEEGVWLWQMTLYPPDSLDGDYSLSLYFSGTIG